MADNNDSYGYNTADDQTQAVPMMETFDPQALMQMYTPVFDQIDPAALMATGTDEPEFLFPESKNKGRSFTEQTCYSTGAAYLAGSVFGAAYGAFEGLRHPAAISPKLKLNTMTTSVYKRSPFLGNTFGVLALMYGGVNYGMQSALSVDDGPELKVTSGAVAGTLYRSTAGPRAMAIGGVSGALLVASFLIIRAIVRQEEIPFVPAIQDKDISA
eukprot:m.7082 g.7082  ORF g.7082 m.7082 type:complete len:214 (+) comp5216_c0_seq2:396-1037(+)